MCESHPDFAEDRRKSGKLAPIEAQEALSRADFIFRLKIVRKELKESRHWIRAILATNSPPPEIFKRLLKEADELILILSKSVETAEKR